MHATKHRKKEEKSNQGPSKASQRPIDCQEENFVQEQDEYA